MVVSGEFIEIAKRGRRPENRFRLGGKCAEQACNHWKDDQCGLIYEMMERLPMDSTKNLELPRCAIRQECRWYNQIGSKACMVCPWVITDINIKDKSS
jgi:hypothetical protein